jgi:hypothetical protein
VKKETNIRKKARYKKDRRRFGKGQKKMEVAKKEGKSKEEKLADGKLKKRRIREEMRQYFN